MTVDPWQLVIAGRFQDAYEQYSDMLKAGPSIPTLNGRGTTLLNMGRLSEACVDFRQAVELAWRELDGSASTCAKLGTTLWLMGEAQQAVEAWTSGLKAKYGDAAGGVELPALLLYAAVKTADTDLENLSLKLLKKRAGSANWPGAIAELYLGRLSPSGVRRAARSSALGVRQQCQADFHLGVYALKYGAPDLARNCWLAAAAAQPNARLEKEYYLARAEVGDDVAKLSLLDRARIHVHAWVGYRKLDRLGKGSE